MSVMKEAHRVTVALAGNPNVGKSTLFNALTGLHQHTGNWSGKTVGIAKGKARQGSTLLEFADLPGTYALDGGGEEERIASSYIRSGEADCTVVVCDGSSLERSLILALQVLQMTSRVVVCVNLIDEAARNGVTVDAGVLARWLDAPVVLTAAGKKQGLKELTHQILAAAAGPDRALPEWNDHVRAAEEIARAAVTRRENPALRRQRIIDRLLVSRRVGIPLMLLLLLAVVYITVWGANYPSELLGRLLDRGYMALKQCLGWVPDLLSGALADGVYATAARVISVMLPPMAIFFPLFTVLENVGYLPRIAFLLDGGMRRCGGCGKQALTLCMGLGCNAVGVMGCRIIESPRERLLAILTNAFVPCNGRFPTLILLGSLFFSRGWSALAVAGCVVVGVVGAMAVSGGLSRTILSREESTFLMELPPFRRPRFGQILLQSLIQRTLRICVRALRVAAPAGLLLWMLANTPLLGACVRILDPLGRVMGLNGVILLAFLFSFPANELFIPVVFMALTNALSLQGVGTVGSELLLSAGWTWKTAICAMTFTLFHWPCATTLMTVYSETGSKKETAAAFLLPTAVGALLCVMLNMVFMEF